jgi:hypothetical protein
MSIAEKLTTIAENEQRVYDSGYSKGELDMWDGIQNFGKRTFYEQVFRSWGSEYIRPKYKVVPSSSSRSISIFESCSNLKKIESEYFDLSNFTPSNNASSTSSHYATFRYCGALEEIEDIGMQAGGYYNTFNRCNKLHTIAVMRCVKAGGYDGVFTQCYELANITIEGEIGNNITFADCSKLIIESLRSIITALYDFVGNGETTTRTLTLHTDAKARLTEDDIKTITDKGWTLV